jgi:hypothetical protein
MVLSLYSQDSSIRSVYIRGWSLIIDGLIFIELAPPCEAAEPLLSQRIQLIQRSAIFL